MKRKIASPVNAPSCYFRTSVMYPYRKALMQITERCNLHCAHCFVSSGLHGKQLTYEEIAEMIPYLKKLNIITITLTGGEPFMHERLIDIIKLFKLNDIQVSICSNATLISKQQIEQIVEIGDVYINVSLDGFSPDTHGKFRGDRNSFYKTIETIKLLGQYEILKGILVTPNALSQVEEYSSLCQFAIDSNAKYVLMNPLSDFGRGIKSKHSLAAPSKMMKSIVGITKQFQEALDMALIRFPNQNLPLSGCEAGKIVYIFTDGNVAICPYLVFAAKNPRSVYSPDEFIAGKILDKNLDEHIEALTSRHLINQGKNIVCNNCDLHLSCGKGCPSAIVASGKKISEVDDEVCPLYYKGD